MKKQNKITRKGTTSIVVCIQVPVVIREVQKYNPDGSEKPLELIEVKLRKSLLKSVRLSKQDITDYFNDSNDGELQDVFHEDRRLGK